MPGQGKEGAASGVLSGGFLGREGMPGVWCLLKRIGGVSIRREQVQLRQTGLKGLRALCVSSRSTHGGNVINF